ncbi:ChaN family lipoprotein [uncultured Cohaesibacter sp.]|uniref:ChaN family lipoprotein n=1 Tax=uncultured Cohaesibacter sp. TaxID=1002546 RepID=UPI00292E056F|nr:ChaN family lipoprotein [uncultured Cohaesibacter sp.]
MRSQCNFRSIFLPMAPLYVAFIVAIGAFVPLHMAKTEQDHIPMLLHDHPLAETIWRTSDAAPATIQEIETALESAEMILLGEKHDNPRHHLLQAKMLDGIGQWSNRAHVIFEMLEPGQSKVLDEVNAGRAKPLAGENGAAGSAAEMLDARLAALGEALEWEERGWPDWAIYQPIFRQALSHSMVLGAGNPDRKTLMDVGRGSQLSDGLLDDLRWDQTYSEAQREDLVDELVEAHCGMIGRDAVSPMVSMQRFKDAHMARAMRRAQRESDVVILIAGNGHVRKDRGVPIFLDRPEKQLRIAFVEVVRGEENARAYPAFGPALYDYIWFTPRVDEEDPCERFRAQLKAMKDKNDRP